MFSNLAVCENSPMQTSKNRFDSVLLHFLAKKRWKLTNSAVQQTIIYIFAGEIEGQR